MKKSTQISPLYSSKNTESSSICFVYFSNTHFTQKLKNHILLLCVMSCVHYYFFHAVYVVSPKKRSKFVTM